MSVFALLIAVSAHCMDVAVIIPVFNGEAHVGETLDSVRAQTLPPKEIVVVDDGSTDRTVDVVKGYEEVTLLTSPGEGPGAARNHGVQHTEADVVAFLDHDDLWHSEHLRLLVKALQANPASPVASAQRVTFSGDEEPDYSLAADRPAFTLYDPWTDFPCNNINEPVCHVIRRQALDEVGGWSSSFNGCEDYHLLLRLALLGPFVRMKSATAGYRLHDGSYWERLAVERGPNHYAHRVAACKDALDVRSARGLPVGAYLQRWESMDALATMLQAWAQGDISRFRQAVRRFDASITHLSADTVEGIRRQFYSFVTPYLRVSCGLEFADEALRWLRQWPADADRARRALPWWGINRLPTADLIRRSLFQPSVWPHLLGHVVRRLRAKMTSRPRGTVSWAK
jgi:glycosyltransferase involved in cell wall biosynthesis